MDLPIQQKPLQKERDMQGGNRKINPSFSKAEITQERLAELGKVLISKGDRMFAEAPLECNELVNAGPRSVPVLIEAMRQVDPRDVLHIACTAVGIGIKIVRTDPQAVDMFIEAVKTEAAPMRYLVDVLDKVTSDCDRPRVAAAMQELLAAGLEMRQDRESKPKGTILASLAMSTLARVGSIDDALYMTSLLSNNSKEIRASAGAGVEYFSKQKDVSEGHVDALARALVNSLEPNSGGYEAGKCEVIAKGNFLKPLDRLMETNPELFDPDRIGKATYGYLMNECFVSSPKMREHLYGFLAIKVHTNGNKIMDLKKLLAENTEIQENFETAINVIKINMRKVPEGALPFGETAKIASYLEYAVLNQGISDSVKLKIAEILSYLPQSQTVTIREAIYDTGTPALKEYVAEIFNRPPKREKRMHEPTILVVDSDEAFGRRLHDSMHEILSDKGFPSISVTYAKNFNEASNIVYSENKLIGCVVSQRLDASEYVSGRHGKTGTWISLLEVLESKGMDIPFVVGQTIADTTAQKNHLKSSINATIVKKSLLLEKQSLKDLLENSGFFATLKHEEAPKFEVSRYLGHPSVREVLSAASMTGVFGARENANDEKIKFVEHDWGVLIESSMPPESAERVRYLILMPGQQTPMADHPGIAHASLKHLGGLRLDTGKVTDAHRSVRVYFDLGGNEPSGSIMEGPILSKHVVFEFKQEQNARQAFKEYGIYLRDYAPLDALMEKDNGEAIVVGLDKMEYIVRKNDNAINVYTKLGNFTDLIREDGRGVWHSLSNIGRDAVFLEIRDFKMADSTSISKNADGTDTDKKTGNAPTEPAA